MTHWRSTNPPEGYGRPPTPRQETATPLSQVSCRGFSFARDLFAALVWVGFAVVALVCLLIPPGIIGWLIFFE